MNSVGKDSRQREQQSVKALRQDRAPCLRDSKESRGTGCNE